MLVTFLVLIASGSVELNVKTKLIFLSGSAEKIYDGTPLSCEDWELVSGELQKGHTAVATVYAVRTDAGTSDNSFSVEIFDGRGKNATQNYDIEYRPGELVVIARRIAIKTFDASKIYDGTPLTCDGFESVGEDVLPSHELSVQVLGTRTDAGVSDNIFSALITDSGDKDVTHNYEIERIYGALEVKKRSITIQTDSYHSVYDGNSLTFDAWKFASETKILDDHEIEVIISGSQTDAGVGKNTVGEVVIAQDGKNMTDNYDIKIIEGDLIVTARSITVRSESDSKPYDGYALTNNNWEFVSQARPMETHEIFVTVSGTQTQVGSSPNYIAEVTVYDEDGQNITFNYEIIRQNGTLTVTDGAGTDPGGSGGGGSGPGGSGGGGIDLDENGQIGSSEDGAEGNAIVARVHSENSGKIYLRYMSFGDYAGTKWEAAPEYNGLIEGKYSLNYLMGIALKNAGLTSSPVSIEVFGSNYLLPYYLDTDALSYQIQTSDVKHSGSTANEYSAYYYMFDYLNSSLALSLPAKYAEAESLYHEYVKLNYLAIGGATNAFFQDIISQNNFDKSNADIVSAVAAYIRGAAVYNILYDKELDNSADIAVSFLGSYKQGICSHFATAATMLYRALGIPARYVIGYMGNTQSGEWVEIADENAHAWVEVYLGGIGWVQVEVTGAGAGFEDGGGGGSGGGGSGGGDGSGGGSGGGSDGATLRIKPVDLSKKFSNGVVLDAENRIQGLSELLEIGYSYNAEVTGRQTTIGIGYSLITSFTLYDSLGKDVTDSFNIISSRGKLHLYVRELSVTTESSNKVYNATPLFSGDESCSLEGELISGHSLGKFAATGSQTDVGKSENSCDIQVIDAFGNDVTYMYKINRNYGFLTVSARQITVTAGSASRAYNGTALSCSDYLISAEGMLEPLGEGDRETVTLFGSQTSIGRSQNRVESIVIINKNGKDVTKNYSIQDIAGSLVVTVP